MEIILLQIYPTLLALLLGAGGLTSRNKIFKQGTVIVSMISGLRTSTDIMNSVITVTTDNKVTEIRLRLYTSPV